MARDNTILMEEVRIIFRNFTGRAGKYNKEGEKNFAVLIDDTMANTLSQDGWNVKWLKPRDDDEDDTPPQAYLPVTVEYMKGIPPRCVMITSRGRTNLSADTVEILDGVDIKTVDMILNPYPWAVNGKSGITAYLKSLYVTIEEDALELKYADLDQQ
jgi:hypothetical protein